jgi:hypothetical protein
LCKSANGMMETGREGGMRKIDREREREREKERKRERERERKRKRPTLREKN